MRMGLEGVKKPHVAFICNCCCGFLEPTAADTTVANHYAIESIPPSKASIIVVKASITAIPNPKTIKQSKPPLWTSPVPSAVSGIVAIYELATFLAKATPNSSVSSLSHRLERNKQNG